MRSEVKYTIPASLPEDPPTNVWVDWSIGIEIQGRGENADVVINGTPLAVTVELGQEQFVCKVPASQFSKPLRDWIDARAKDLNPDVLGLSFKECMQEALEQEMGTDDE